MKTNVIVLVNQNIQYIGDKLPHIFQMSATVRCGKRTKESCIKVLSLCAWRDGKCETAFLKDLKTLEHRHCFYYSYKQTDPLSRDTKLDLKSSYKSKYDSSKQLPFNIHIGQRKLLLSEIQLLTTWYMEHPTIHPTVLYIGAAPGTHLLLLSKLFPSVSFVLYDGARFDRRLHKPVFCVNKGFVDTQQIRDMRTKFDENSLIFISDIRLDAPNDDAFESAVTRDMELQQEWLSILQPKMSLLKFRMSYNMKHGDTLMYTKGDLMYQLWAKPASGETRLFVRKEDINVHIPYDFKDYEETMAFHNNFKRPYCYHDIPPELRSYIFAPSGHAYCPCHDCVMELTVLFDYSKTMKKEMDWVIKIVSNGRQLKYPDHQPAIKPLPY